MLVGHVVLDGMLTGEDFAAEIAVEGKSYLRMAVFIIRPVK